MHIVWVLLNARESCCLAAFQQSSKHHVPEVNGIAQTSAAKVLTYIFAILGCWLISNEIRGMRDPVAFAMLDQASAAS